MTALTPILITLKLAFFATLILLAVGLPLAYWLAYTRQKWRPVVEAIISLPIVLPPTVLGFYLLLILSPNSGLGNWLDDLMGLRFVFTFEGLVLASMIYSLPFMVHPLQAGLIGIPRSLREASILLGKSTWTTFWRVLVPNMKPAIVTAIVLTFAHTIGEFGLVLMIGGSIPGVTKVASIAIYEEVEALNYSAAHILSGILVVLSFFILLVIFIINSRYRRRS